MALQKQDRNGSRTPADVERRHKLKLIEETSQDVEKLKEDIVVDTALSSSSTHPVENQVITKALANKVNKEEGKGLSSNDFTDDYVERINNATGKSHSHNNKSVLDTITQTDINKWNSASETPTYNYNLSSYKVSGLSILRSSCYVKNSRVCINFVGTLSMEANATTTLFNLPSGIRPMATKDFVVFGQSSNTTGYIGYGYVTSDGLLQVRFNQAISSYIRFSVTYDLD